MRSFVIQYIYRQFYSCPVGRPTIKIAFLTNISSVIFHLVQLQVFSSGLNFGY